MKRYLEQRMSCGFHMLIIKCLLLLYDVFFLKKNRGDLMIEGN